MTWLKFCNDPKDKQDPGCSGGEGEGRKGEGDKRWRGEGERRREEGERRRGGEKETGEKREEKGERDPLYPLKQVDLDRHQGLHCFSFHLHPFGVKTTVLKFEPRHDKTNKIAVRPAKTQISLGIRPV